MHLLRRLCPRQFVELHETYSGNPALGRILSMVAAAGCETIVREDDVDEDEYASELDALYKDVLAVNATAKPVRLHFFEGDVPDIADIKKDDSRYMGYCDLRPIPTCSISTALIDRRVFLRGNSEFLFLVCDRSFDVRLTNGVMLKVRGFPYVQQDGAIVRCAQAALRSIAMFYDKDITGPAFTKVGAAYPSGTRSIPSSGLNSFQIGMGFQEMGLEPINYDFASMPQEFKDVVHPEQIIYRYMESRIPVLIGVNAGRELHALVVIGHSFTPDSWWAHTRTEYYEQPKSGWNYHCSTNWVERFIVQDDNLGPYMLAPSDFLKQYACQLVVVPLPSKVFMKGEEAEKFASDLLSPSIHHISQVLDHYIDEHEKAKKPRDDDTKFWYNQFREQVNKQDLVLRTSLMSREDWLEWSKTSDVYPHYESILNQLPWPDYVWVVEISWPSIFLHRRMYGGEIVLDPTAVISSRISTLKQAWLWMHAPGVIAYRDGKSGKADVSVLEVRDTVRPHRRTVI